MSPADQTPFPLIKSFEIFHLSVSACCRGEQPTVSVDCVILQFTSDTDNIITVSLMAPFGLLLLKPLPTLLISIFFFFSDALFAHLHPLYHSDTGTIS